MPIVSDDLKELIRRMSVSAENCMDIPIDMRTLQFTSSEEEMSLRDGKVGEIFYFKFDKEKPNDPCVTHAQRQFCRLIKVPYQFFADNRPVTRNQIVKNWLTANAPEMGDESLILVKVREGGIVKVVRAIVPLNHVSLYNHEIVSLLTDNVDATTKVDLEWSTGDTRDDLVFHARILYGEKIDDSYRVGVSVFSSELGASDLVVDSFLYHEESKTYIVPQFGKESYAKIQYGKVQPSEIKELLSGIPKRIIEDGSRYLSALDAASMSYPGVERACSILSSRKGLPTKFKRSLYLEAEAAHEDMTTLHDFARHVGLVAKDFDLNSRMKLERAIGAFCGMSFDKT